LVRRSSGFYYSFYLDYSRILPASLDKHARKNLQEYIYTKYTSHSGLAYYPQGYFYTFYEAFKNFLKGLLFICLALLLGSWLPVIHEVCLVGAIYYLFRALVWFVPGTSWKWKDAKERWERIKELEIKLWGKPQEDTLEYLKKSESEKN
jgi:hypothetical protein